MSQLTSLQNKIQAKIFDKIATDGTIETATASRDKWGDDTPSYASAVALKIVPYNNFTYRRNYQPFGDLGENESDAVIPYGTTIAEGDRITFDSQAYKIIDIEKFLFSGGNLAYAIRLVKSH